MTEQTLDPRNEQMGVNSNTSQMSAVQAGGGVQAIPMAQIGVNGTTPMQSQNIFPVNYQAALSTYTEAEQQEIRSLADRIDVRKIENVMNYGSTPLKRTFEQCGEFLKKEQGSRADQQVMAQVIELSKKATQSYEDFNFQIREPGLFQKVLMKMFGNGNGPRMKALKDSAATCYQLLKDLEKASKSWEAVLKEAYREIEVSAKDEFDSIVLLEKYLIAGNLAEERIVQEIAEAEQQYAATGLQQYAQEVDVLKSGHEVFQHNMQYLEQSHITYRIVIGQLALARKGNINAQLTIGAQTKHSLTLISQQLRNGLISTKTQSVIDAQKALSGFSDELIKGVSESIASTAQDSTKLLNEGFCSMEAAKSAITTIYESFEAIKNAAAEALPKIKADMSEAEVMLNQLEPYIASRPALNQGNSTPTNVGSGQLKF